MASWTHLLPQAPKPTSFQDAFAHGERLGMMRQQRELYRQRAIEEGLKIQERQAAMQDEQKVNQLYQQHNGDVAKILEAAPSAGVRAQTVEKIRQYDTKRRQEAAAADKAKLETDLAHADRMLGRFDRILAESDPVKQAAIYAQERQDAIAAKDIDEASVPAQYPGLDAIRSLYPRLQGHKLYTEEGLKAKQETRAAEREKRDAQSFPIEQETKQNQAITTGMDVAGRVASAMTEPKPTAEGKTFETKLTPPEEAAFKAWKAKYAPNDSGDDYDLRGAFKAGLTPDPKTGHWPDTFKKPNHPTFSVESQYAKDAPDKAGHWEGDTFVPPEPVDNEATYQKVLGSLPASTAKIIKSLPGFEHYSEGVYDKIKKRFGLNVNQQMAEQARENRPAQTKNDRQEAATILGATPNAAEYTRAYDRLEQKYKDTDWWPTVPKPQDWSEKTTAQVRLLGSTPAQQFPQTKPTKAPGGAGLTPAQERMWVNEHKRLQADEQKEWDRHGALGDVLKVKIGEPFIDPDDKQHREVNMTEARRNEIMGRFNASERKANQLQNEARNIRKRFGWGQQEGTQQGTTPAGAAPAKPKRTPQKGDIRTYNGATYQFDGEQWKRQ